MDDSLVDIDGVAQFPMIADSHLQSPITNHLRIQCADLLEGLPTKAEIRTRVFVDKIRALGLVSSWNIMSEAIYPIILSRAYANDAGEVPFQMRQSLRVAATNLSEQLLSLSAATSLPLDRCTQLLHYMHQSDDIILPLVPAYTIKVELETIRDQIQYNQAHNVTTSLLSSAAVNGYTVFAYHPLLLFVHPRDRVGHILEYNQFLCLLDASAARYLCLYYLTVESLISAVPTLSIATFIDALTWGDNALRRYENNGYNIIKGFEGYVVGTILKYNEALRINGRYLDTVAKDMNDKELEYDPTIMPASYLSTILDDILRPIRHNPDKLSELFGIYRIWGHPTVDEVGGCRKVQEIALLRKDDAIKDDTALNCSSRITREIIRNYLVENKRWPDIWMEDEIIGTPLHQAWISGSTHINEFATTFEVRHWRHVHFNKNAEYDYTPDVISLMKDSAISMPLKYWDNVYSPTALGYKPPKPYNFYRRAMQQYLCTPIIDMTMIINMVVHGEVPNDWLVLGVHAKERELKIHARLFGMMVLEMRLYFASTEMNISKTIFKYLPQQTMTMSEAQLLTHLLTISCPKPTATFVTVFINVDFLSWNIQWRDKSTQGVFRSIGEFFGMPNLYTYTHEFFYKALIYLVSRECPPPNLSERNRLNPPDSRTCWRGHLGGIEGLRQKGWTTTTISLILEAQARTGIAGVVTGQGDNQVIAAQFPIVHDGVSPESYMRDYSIEFEARIEKYLLVLSEVAKEMAVPIKTEETWVSQTFVAYSKDFIKNGAMLPSTLKRICRIITDLNDTIPLLMNKLATLHAAGQSSAHKGLSAITSYLVTQAECVTAIQKDYQLSVIGGAGMKFAIKTHDIRLTDSFLDFIITVPRALGGFPVLSLLDYLYRGHPDPLTGALTALKLRCTHNAYYRRLLHYWIHTPPFSNKVDLLMIIQDPVSINIVIPTLVSNYLLHELETTIKGAAKNLDVKSLFKAGSDHEDDELITFLQAVRPFSPRVLSELYLRSATGARKAFLACFNHMRTVRNMVRWDAHKDLLGRIKELEVNWLVYLHIYYLRVHHVPSTVDIANFCVTHLAQYLRDHSWFEGRIEVEGVTVPHPLEQFVLLGASMETVLNITGPHIVIILDSRPLDPRDAGKPVVLTRGLYPPYIGSKTQEKITHKLMELQKRDSAIHDAGRLLLIKDWAVVQPSPLATLIDRIVATRTNIPSGYLSSIVGKVAGGSITHRFSDPMTKHAAAVNTRPNTHTHCYISSDKMGHYSGGLQNYSIHFQGVYLCSLSLINEYCLRQGILSGTGKYVIYIKLCCDNCTRLIVDDRLSVPEDIHIPTLAIDVNNKLLFSPMENLLIDNLPTPEIGYSSLKHTDVTNAQLLQVYTSILIADQYHKALLGSRVVILPGLGKAVSNIVLTLNDFAVIPLPKIIRHLANSILLTLGSEIVISLCYSNLPHTTLLPAMIAALKVENVAFLAPFLSLPYVRAQAMSQKLGGVMSSEAFKSPYKAITTIKGWVSRIILRNLSDPTMLFSKYYIPAAKSIGYNSIYISWLSLYMAVLLILYPERRIAETSDLMIRMRAALSDQSGSDLRILTYRFRAYIDLYFAVGHNWKIARDLPTIVNGDISDWRVQCYERLAHTVMHLPSRINLMTHYAHLTADYISSAEYATADSDYATLASYPEEDRYLPAISIRTDHYYRMYGQFSTAHYKLLEIVLQERISPHRIMTLAEGSGSMAAMLLSIFPNATLFYNSYHDLQDFNQHRASSFIPICLDKPTLVNRLIGIQSSILYNNDLTLWSTFRDIIGIIGDQTFDFITCDAEFAGPDTTLSVKILRTALLLASRVGTPDNILVLKTFLKNSKLVDYQLRCCRVLYTTTRLVVPVYGSPISGEAFLICYGMRAHSILHDIDPQLYYREDKLYVITGESLFVDAIKAQFLALPKEAYQPLLPARSRELNIMAKQYESPTILTALSAYSGGLIIQVPNNLGDLKTSIPVLLNTILHMANKLVSGYRSLFTAQAIRLPIRSMRKHQKISTHLTELAELYGKLQLLYALIECPTYRNSNILQLITAFAQSPIVLHLRYRINYKHTLNVQTWCQQYSRHLFQILGYYENPLGLAV